MVMDGVRAVTVKLTLLISDLHLYMPNQSTADFAVGGNLDVEFSLKPIDEENRRDDAKAICQSTYTTNVDAPIFEALRSMAASPTATNLDDLTERPRAFLQDTYLHILSATQRMVKLLRWVYGQRGRSNPFRDESIAFSIDNRVTWHPLALPLSVYGYSIRPIAPAENAFAFVSSLLTSGTREPLGHELIRDAWQQRVASPRSALVAAVSAVEVGLKELISDLVPQAEWLALETQTPPVVKMLKNYLPTLPVRLTLNDEAPPPPPRVRRIIQDAVEQRNAISHQGARPPDIRALLEIIEAVEDTLWLFDYYRGHHWALRIISHETQSELDIQV